MHRTNHLVDRSFVPRSPDYAAPRHTVDNSALRALLELTKLESLNPPEVPALNVVVDPPEYRISRVGSIPLWRTLDGPFSENRRPLLRVSRTAKPEKQSF